MLKNEVIVHQVNIQKLGILVTQVVRIRVIIFIDLVAFEDRDRVQLSVLYFAAEIKVVRVDCALLWIRGFDIFSVIDDIAVVAEGHNILPQLQIIVFNPMVRCLVEPDLPVNFVVGAGVLPRAAYDPFD